jgi:hypothetical protein
VPRAVHRLLQLYGLPSTTSICRNPAVLNAMASHRTVSGVALARRHQLSCYSPGVARPTRRLAAPAATSVAPLWIYPNLSYLRHPLSLTSTHRRPEQTMAGGQTDTQRPQALSLASPSARDESLMPDGRTSSPGSQRRNVARLEGPPPATTRESADSQPHPGCLPPSGPTPPFERRW